MRTKNITGILLTLFTAVSLHEASAQPINLTGTSYTNTFDDLESNQGIPPEWTTYTAATATAPGTIAAWTAVNYTATSNSWRFTNGRFANQASTFSYIGGTNFLGTETNNPTQWVEPNRTMAVRQVSGTDVGVAFVLKIADTLGRKNFVLSADLLNLDPTSTRTTTWTVDYGVGSPPSSFVPVATYVNTAGTFNAFHTNITFPNGTIDNSAGPVWVRFVVLTGTTGSGNRETFGIDNFGLTWEPGVACTPVTITGQPADYNGFINGNASFTVGAVGTTPRYYAWLKNGTTALSDDGHFGGTGTPTLTITTLQAGDAGTYSCVVSNVCDGTLYTRTSSGAVLKVSAPPSVSIGYLRTLVDPASWGPTNSSLLYTATGMITTLTNTTTANTASYYLQDGTGGINLFCTFGSSFRPSIGDVVTTVGFLSSFGGNLELEANLNDPAQGVVVLSNNIAAYPAPQVVSWDNLYQFGTNATLNYNTAGSIVLLTNVYFKTPGVVTTNGNYTLAVTNALGQAAIVYLPGALDNDLTNRTIPAFASSAQGPLIVSSTAAYQVMVTRWSDIVTNAPTVVTAVTNVTVSLGAGNTLNISYAGGSASQFILVGTNQVTAPLAAWPVIRTTNGTTPATFTVPIGSETQIYYKIKSQ
jgi:hypothetical protein